MPRGRGGRSRSTTPASTCCAPRTAATYVLELNGIPGWRGLQEATGADVAAALVEHVEALVSAAPPARARR